MLPKIFNATRQHFRRSRYLQIQELMKVESLPGLVMDLGGGPASFFAAMFPKPKQIVLVDIDYKSAYQAKRKRPGIQIVIADGGQLPIANNSIQVVVCNSVIEHVANPAALAIEIQRVSQNYFLQTPNGEFPLETHSFIAIPFYNFIPWLWLRRFMCRLFRANFEYVDSVHYLSEQRLKSLFPEAVMIYERVLGLKKSFYVYYFSKDT